jgi:hypothetical protein
MRKIAFSLALFLSINLTYAQQHDLVKYANTLQGTNSIYRAKALNTNGKQSPSAGLSKRTSAAPGLATMPFFH